MVGLPWGESLVGLAESPFFSGFGFAAVARSSSIWAWSEASSAAMLSGISSGSGAGGSAGSLAAAAAQSSTASAQAGAKKR